MGKMIKKTVVVAFIVALAGAVGAEVVFNTILNPATPSGDRANLTAPSGQTFLTGTLGASNQLSIIDIQAADSGLSGDQPLPALRHAACQRRDKSESCDCHFSHLGEDSRGSAASTAGSRRRQRSCLEIRNSAG